MERTLLLIDDRSEHLSVLDNIKTNLKTSKSIDLSTKYLNPNDQQFWNDQKDPDISKVIEGIKKKLSSLKPSLILVDQYYSANIFFNGIDIIERLRSIPKFKECPIFIISGSRDRIVKEIFENEGNEKKDKVSNLAKLINLKINRFLDKDFRSEAIEELSKVKIDDILPTKLRDYEGENVVINRFSPKYKTLTFTELADKIENNDSETVNILDEMFELTLSHYVGINEKL